MATQTKNDRSGSVKEYFARRGNASTPRTETGARPAGNDETAGAKAAETVESGAQDVVPVTDETSEHTAHTAPIPSAEPDESSDLPVVNADTADSRDSTDSIDTRPGADSDQTRRTVKQRRSDLDEYKRRYMQTPRIEDRKPVFVSRATRDRLDRIVRLLGERGMSVSGLIENIARHHLDTHEPEVEHWWKM